MQAIRRLWNDRRGATAVEYGIILAVLSLVIVAGVGKAGNALSTLLMDDHNRLVQATK